MEGEWGWGGWGTGNRKDGKSKEGDFTVGKTKKWVVLEGWAWWARWPYRGYDTPVCFGENHSPSLGLSSVKQEMGGGSTH